MAASRILSIGVVLYSKRMRLPEMGNAKDEFHMTAIAQNPGHVTATFIVPELQGPLFARGSYEDPAIRQRQAVPLRSLSSVSDVGV